MRFISLIVFVVLLLLWSGCVSSSKMNNKKYQSDNNRRANQTTLPVEKKRTTQIHYTFIDTLNRENELLLTDGDFENESKPNESVISSDALPESLYRIQIFASNSIETIREQKKELEKNTDEPVFIGYDAPYYKLYAGGFVKKQDASLTLSKLKKIGYLDAWIVSTRMNQ